jgi:hypothetical protein
MLDVQGRGKPYPYYTLLLCSDSAARFSLDNEFSTTRSSTFEPKCSSSHPNHPEGRVKSQPYWTRHDTASTEVQVIAT